MRTWSCLGLPAVTWLFLTLPAFLLADDALEVPEERCNSPSSDLESFFEDEHPPLSLLQTKAKHIQASQESAFGSFIMTHGREYAVGSAEYEMRRGVFENRLAQVQLQNSKAQRRWTAAVNHFADRTDSELAQLNGWRGVAVAARGSGKSVPASKGVLLSYSTNALPREVNWAHLKAAGAGTDQGECGSCWAVTTSTVLNANAEIRGHNRTFSTQDILDCTPNPHHCGGTGGCEGSTVELAMNWIMENGIKDQAEAPYLGRDDKCAVAPKGPLSALSASSTLEEMIHVGFHGSKSQLSPGLSLGLRGWERLPENEYKPLMLAVAHTGPVAVSVGASFSWSMYSSGVFDACSRDAVMNHAVTLIGYGEDATTKEKYWLIKNSWGPVWGEDGNIRLLRQDSDETDYCGVDKKPSEGTGCDGGPAEVKVCGMCGILYDSVVPYFH